MSERSSARISLSADPVANVALNEEECDSSRVSLKWLIFLLAIDRDQDRRWCLFDVSFESK